MPKVNCAIYTRKSAEYGLKIEFDSLHKLENERATPRLCGALLLGFNQEKDTILPRCLLLLQLPYIYFSTNRLFVSLALRTNLPNKGNNLQSSHHL